MELSRRSFFKRSLLAAGSGSAVAFASGSARAEADCLKKPYKLESVKEVTNICCYCSGGCGTICSSRNGELINLEGDPDHPVNRGALCPKGAGLVDFIHSESRLKFPEYRAPGSDKWQQISWDEAFDRIAKLMKEDRDANFIAQNDAGTTVNRWLTTGMLCASASSNETGYLTQKFTRALGMLAVDNQARV